MFDLTRVLALFTRDTMIALFSNSITPTLEISFAAWIDWAMVFVGVAGTVAGAIWVVSSMQLIIIPCLSCLVSYALSIVSVWLILFTRVILLYVMVMLAPIVFMLRIIPEFQSYSKTWFDSMIKMLLLYPLGVLLYYVLLVMGSLFSNG
jgi:hypothetical protein